MEKTIEKNKKILEDLRRESGDLSVKTGHPDEITELLSQINQIIESNRLDVNLIVPQQGIDGRFFKWAPFQMDLSGSFASLIAFMEEIKNLDDAVDIRNLVLENSGEKKGINIKFTLKI